MTADPPTGDLTAVLILFAAWRPCTSCGDRVLFVDEEAKTDSPFLCGGCEEHREALGRECRPARRRSLDGFVGIPTVREACS